MINRRNRYCLKKTVIMTKMTESFGDISKFNLDKCNDDIFRLI